MKAFAKKVKWERERHAWSQEQLAEMIETTTHNVSRWERGLNFPGPYFRQKLCELFGKSAEELSFVQEEREDEQEPLPVPPYVDLPTSPSLFAIYSALEHPLSTQSVLHWSRGGALASACHVASRQLSGSGTGTSSQWVRRHRENEYSH